jgi:hypothetical protein
MAMFLSFNAILYYSQKTFKDSLLIVEANRISDSLLWVILSQLEGQFPFEDSLSCLENLMTS